MDTSDPESEPFVSVHALTLGAVHDLVELGGWPVGLGGMVTAHAFDDVLDPVYGSHPLGLYLFVRVRAPRMGPGSPASPPGVGTHRH